MLKRIKTRIPEETNEELLNELLTSAKDRICLRLGANTLPSCFESICVEVVVKAYRRLYFEGIQSESADTLNTTFIPDLLAEYENEFNTYLANKEKEENKEKGIVRFL